MIALTIDYEQWNPLTIRGEYASDENNTKYSLEGNKKLLDILDKFNAKCTFFTTGYFAENEKEQTREISRKHEIASHGYNHFYRDNKNLDMFKDIKKSKDILEKITKKKITGFRAPQAQFSLKLINILNKLKFSYDSSLHPAHMPFYYDKANYPLKPFKPLAYSKIKEIPISVRPLTRLPISWLFMRNFGSYWTSSACRALLKKGITPVIYVHSWEFYKIKNNKLPYYYTRHTGNKFCRILIDFLKKFKDEEFVTLNKI